MSGERKDDIDARGDLKHARFASAYHAPVLCNAVVEGLITNRSGLYVDCTLGGGGHTEAILEELDRKGHVVGIDRDQDAIDASSERLTSEIEGGRFSAIRGDFFSLKGLLAERRITTVDGILLDLGVSSHQLDKGKRGFSHRLEGPLDMRMDSDDPEDAQSVLNTWSEAELTRVLRQFGEQTGANRIARKIVYRA